MRICTLLLSLAVVSLVGIDASAQNATKHPLRDRFEKMDVNHDGILTLAEFVTGHPKMGAQKATQFYQQLVTLGGSTAKGSAAGMTFPQFRTAHKLWKQAHPKQSPGAVSVRVRS